VPPGWDTMRLTVRMVRTACEYGVPVIWDSVHGVDKIRRHQGRIVIAPDGRVWRPPKAPVVFWHGRRREWEVTGDFESILRCGCDAVRPKGELIKSEVVERWL